VPFDRYRTRDVVPFLRQHFFDEGKNIRIVVHYGDCRHIHSQTMALQVRAVVMTGLPVSRERPNP
jgi:hypothetical protein